MRAGAVGLDPWRVLDAVADDALIAEAFIAQLEANEIAKAEAQANMTAYRTTEGLLGILEMLGIVHRR